MTLLFVATRMLYVGLSGAPAALGVAVAAVGRVPVQAALAILLLAMLGGGVDFLALGEKSNGESANGPALLIVRLVAVTLHKS